MTLYLHVLRGKHFLQCKDDDLVHNISRVCEHKYQAFVSTWRGASSTPWMLCPQPETLPIPLFDSGYAVGRSPTRVTRTRTHCCHCWHISLTQGLATDKCQYAQVLAMGWFSVVQSVLVLMMEKGGRQDGIRTTNKTLLEFRRTGR